MNVFLIVMLANLLILLFFIGRAVFINRLQLKPAPKSSDNAVLQLDTVTIYAPHRNSLGALRINYPAVYKNLLSQFKKIQQLKYATEDEMLFMSFANNGKEISAVYYQDGRMKYCITNLVTNLPKLKEDKLKAEYPLHNILYCKRITTNNESIYRVILENREEYRVVNMQDEAMIEIQNMKKTAIS